MQAPHRPLRRGGERRLRRALRSREGHAVAAVFVAGLPLLATVAHGQPATGAKGGDARGAPGPRDPLPMITASPAASASVAAAPSSSYRPLTIPMAPVPTATPWRGEYRSDDWYSGYRRARVPVVRVAPGAAFRVSGPGESAFAFDAVVGARLGLTPGNWQLGAFPEVGYGYNKANGEHQITAGIGLGFGELPWWGYTALMPRFVLDPGDGKGFRIGLVTQVVETGISFEIAGQHIYRDVGPNPTDLRLALGVDLFLLGSVVGDSRAWKRAARP